MACTGPPQPPAFCAAFWGVVLALPALESAYEVFCWDTGPELAPGLRIASETAVFDGLYWLDSALEFACWSLIACWPIPWTVGVLGWPQLPHGGGGGEQDPHSVRGAGAAFSI